jgi:hypothetical protein
MDTEESNTNADEGDSGENDADHEENDEYKNKRRQSKRAKKVLTVKDRFIPGVQDVTPPVTKISAPKSKRKRNGVKTAIVIGAGMAGLSAARELEKLKYEVTVLEARKVGDLATYPVAIFSYALRSLSFSAARWRQVQHMAYGAGWRQKQAACGYGGRLGPRHH